MSRVHVQGELRADKIKYPDGVGCCIWYPLPGTEDAGICFDFSAKDIFSMIILLVKLLFAKPDIFEDNKEDNEIVELLKEMVQEASLMCGDELKE